MPERHKSYPNAQHLKAFIQYNMWVLRPFQMDNTELEQSTTLGQEHRFECSIPSLPFNTLDVDTLLDELYLVKSQLQELTKSKSK
jgi:hypothetical protein